MTFEAHDVVDGRFVIERLAKTSGMGTIYRAYDEKTGDRVALKVAKQPNLEPWRFAFEAHLVRNMDHPFVVGFVAQGYTKDGDAYLALEWLEGEDLAERLERGPLSLREALEVIRRVARALCPVHQSGVVHRDLKPANVFLCDQRADRAKLLDFGVARPIRREEPEEDRTGVGISVGTPAYMAPEQVFAGTIDERTDVYSLGALLYECLTGAPPFASKNFASSMLRILNEPPPRLADAWVDCPSALEDLVARMLAKTPKERPSTREVFDEIESLLETLDGVLERTSCTRMKIDVHADTAAA
jgi:serine/threonine protein kinase